MKPGEYLLPVQLIESLFNALLFILLIVCALKIKRKLKILGIYFIGYSVFRFILEFFRYDEIRGFLFGLSTSQFISIFIFAVGMAFLIRDDYLSDKLDKIAGMRARKKARKKDRTIAPS